MDSESGERLYQIHWESKNGHDKGAMDRAMPKEEAKHFARYMNLSMVGFVYTAEPVPEPGNMRIKR